AVGCALSLHDALPIFDPQLVALGAVAGAGEVERAGGAAEQVAPGGAAVGRLLPLVGERDRVAVVVVLGDGRGQQVVGLRRALVGRGRDAYGRRSGVGV